MAGTGKLDGHMALITGGSRGIGAAIGRAFAAEGADVAFCHNDDDVGAAEVEADLRARGRRAFSWRCDLNDMAAARRLFADAEAALGRIDILVNNAGVSQEAAVEAITLDAVDWMLNVHFKATFVLSQPAYISMKARRRAHHQHQLEPRV
jgi:3-oxoacyl-[acyl-carrier protein] reductase